MIKIIELFSGYGSQKLALNKLGFEVESKISEIDKYAIQAYEQIHGKTINYGDISKIKALGNADMWTYSFPCQDLSQAGKQAGIKEGTRSGLLYEVERLLEIAVYKNKNQPKYLLLENVRALVSKKFMPDFKRWLNKLEELGYNNYWKVLNAKEYGIPQNRERVFVVSIRKDVDTKGYIFPNPVPLEKRLKDMLEENVPEKYYLSEDKVAKLLKSIDINKYKITEPLAFDEQNNYIRKDGCVGTIMTDGSSSKHNNRIIYPLFIKEATKKGYAEACEYDSISLDQPNSKTRRGRVGKQICNTLTCSCNIGVVEPKVIQVGNIVSTGNWDNLQRGRIYSPEGICPALNCVGGGGLEPKIILGHLIRKLTPRECWRLMGVTDEQYDRLQGLSDSQLYKLAGNSIVVDVLESIFKNLLMPETTDTKGQLSLF